MLCISSQCGTQLVNKEFETVIFCAFIYDLFKKKEENPSKKEGWIGYWMDDTDSTAAEKGKGKRKGFCSLLYFKYMANDQKRMGSCYTKD